MLESVVNLAKVFDAQQAMFQNSMTALIAQLNLTFKKSRLPNAKLDINQILSYAALTANQSGGNSSQSQIPEFGAGTAALQPLTQWLLSKTT